MAVGTWLLRQPHMHAPTRLAAVLQVSSTCCCWGGPLPAVPLAGRAVQ